MKTILSGLALSSLVLLAAAPPVPMSAIVPDVMPGDVELAVIPTPKRQTAGPNMIVVGSAVLATPDPAALREGGATSLVQALAVEGGAVRLLKPEEYQNPGADTLIVIGNPDAFPLVADAIKPSPQRFSDLKKAENKEQGYLLSVHYDSARRMNVIAVAGLSPQGMYYGIQTLKQIAYKKDGAVYARECDILDWPTFPLRGTKRTVGTWEYALKSNFHYATRPDKKAAEAHFAEWLPIHLPTVDKGLLDATPRGLAEAVEWMKACGNNGAKDFCLHLDDQPRKLVPEAEKTFAGDYQAAVAWLVREFHKAMKRQFPDATLYFMPEPYYTVSDYPEYAAAMKAAGGIPSDVAMHLCGPQVTSRAMPPDDIAAYSEAFGCKPRALIYDNHLRDLDFGPIAPRPAELAKVIVGITPERGTATTRATRLDWAWNPEAYDPDRSLMLACRELAGFENWKKMHDMVSSLEYALPGPLYKPRAEALKEFDRQMLRCADLIKEMQALPNGGMAGRLQPTPAGGPANHPLRGLLDDVFLAGRALTPEEMRMLIDLGAKSFYESLPAEGDALSRKDAVAVWTFDDDPAGAVADLTPNANVGKIIGPGVAYADGRHGKALEFAGTGKGYVEVPHKPEQALHAFTVAAWVKARPSEAAYQAILHKRTAKNERNYSLIISAETATAFCDIWPVRAGGGATKALDGEWHHLAATHDGKETVFYVDGRIENRTAADKPLVPADGPVYLGVGSAPAPSTRATGYAGNVTEQIPAAWEHLAVNRRALIHECSYREAIAVRTPTPPVFDGAPEDDAWGLAPETSRFVISGKGEVVPDNRQTFARFLYDDTYLYIALRMANPGPLKADPDKKPVEDLRPCAPLGRWEAVAILLDPSHTHYGNYQFELDFEGNRADGRYDVAAGESPQGLRFNSGWKSVVLIRENTWSAEIAIPLSSLRVRPGPGHVMGLQIWRGNSLWSYMPRWWGMQEPSQSGHLIFK